MLKLIIMLIKLKNLLLKKLTPIITFHHFTTPEWLMNDGLMASEKVIFICKLC